MRRGKYNAKKTTVDGRTFDSKRESEVYTELKAKKKAGLVVEFECQPRFMLIKPFKAHLNGKTVTMRKAEYVADFRVVLPDGTEEIWDVKGVRTAVYKLKLKVLLALYPDIRFREVA